MVKELRAHEAVKLKAGKYAGLVGEVLEARPHTGMVRVHIAGVQDGKTIDVKRWFPVGVLERAQ